MMNRGGDLDSQLKLLMLDQMQPDPAPPHERCVRPPMNLGEAITLSDRIVVMSAGRGAFADP